MKHALLSIPIFFLCLANVLAENPPFNPLVVNAGNDITICAPGQTVTLNGSVNGPFSGVYWEPSAGMSDPFSLSTDVYVSSTTTFTLTANGQGATSNLIFNGGFEAGAVGFTSDYIPGTGGPWGLLSNEGEYAISTNPILTHTNFADCPGSNMMVVNGSTTPNANIWCQTVTVDPNTTYEFSAWLTSVNPSNPAILQFSVNGVLLGSPFNLSSTTCFWENFFETWESGGATSAEICITNQNTVASGNDFAIDDITFGPVCTGFDQVTVTVVDVAAFAEPIGLIPCNTPSIMLNGNGSSTGPGVTYAWTTTTGNIVSGGNTLTPTVDAPGIYELTVSVNSSFGPCTSTAIVEVLNEPPPEAFASTGNDINCLSTVGTVIGSGSTVGPNTTYLWTSPDGFVISGATDLIAQVGAQGTYTLTVTDGLTGCTAEASTFVSADLNLPTAEAVPDGDLDCNITSVTIDGSGSSGGPNLSFEWSTTNGSITSDTTADTIIVNAAGDYQLVVTNDNNGCSATVSVMVDSDISPPDINIEDPDTLSCAVGNFTLDASGTTGAGNLTFVWTTTDGNIVSGGNTAMPEIDLPGTYTLTVTDDANGCTGEESVLVEGDVTPPIIDIAAPTQLTCTNNELTLDATGSQAGVSFAWTTVNGNIVAGENTAQPTIDQTGTYTLTITDPNNGCTATDDVEVEADQSLPVADAGAVAQLDCTNTTAVLDGTGSSMGTDYTYLWTTADGNILNGETTLEPEIDAGGTYILTVTNIVTGCVSQDNVIIPENNDIPIAVADTPGELNCLNDTQTIDATGSSLGMGYTAIWTTMDGNIVSGANTLEPVVDSAGTYLLTITNLNSNCTSTEEVIVAENFTTPQADPGVVATLTCANDTLQLDGSNSVLGNNDTVVWTTPDGSFAEGDSTLTPTITAPGTYTLVITNNESSCTNIDSVLIDENMTTPTANAGVPMELTCTTTSLALDGSGSSQNGNFTYSWTTSDGNIVSGGNGLMPVVDESGSYLLTVLDIDNGCVNMSEVAVTLNGNFPAADAGATAELTCSITETTLGGSGDVGSEFTYAWTTPDGEIISNDSTLTPVVGATGTYTLTVTNQNNGCSTSDDVFISENTAAPNVDAGPTDELSCTQTQLSLSGIGSAPGNNISYSWATPNGNILSGSTTPNPQVNAAGLYWLTITDNENGCVDSASVTITQDANVPIADAGVTATLTCDVTAIQLDGSGSTVNPNISYLWTTTDGNIVSGETSLSPEINAPGTYLLTVIDAVNDCEAFSSVLINENITPPSANVGPSGLLTCDETSLLLDGSATANGPQFTYQWTTQNGNIISGETTLFPEINAPGEYGLLVTNLTTGCTNTATVEVTEDITPPTVLIENPDVLTCVVLETVLDASNSSMGNQFNYAWTTTNGNIVSNGNSANPTINADGDYELLITNQLTGCTASASISVSENITAPTANAGQVLGLDCNVTTGSLDGMGSSVGNNFQYLWTTFDGNIVFGETTLTPQVDAAGTYTLTVLDGVNGCTSTSAVGVTLDNDTPVIAIFTPTTLTCLETETTIDASGSSMGNAFQYEWTTQNGNIISGGATLQPTVDEPGSYVLVISNNDNGCTSTESANVTENVALPAVEAGPTFELHCHLSEIKLLGNTDLGIGQFTANWETVDGNIASGMQSLSPLVNAPGTYQLSIVNNATGCRDTDEVIVTESIFENFDFEKTEPTCLNSSGSLEFTGVQGGKVPFLYSITNGQNLSTQKSYPGLSPGTYDLMVQDAYGCELTEIAFLSDPPEILVFLEAQAIIQLGESYQLNALSSLPDSEIATVEWTPNETLSCSDCLTPIATPLQQTNYVVRVTSIDGCTATATTAVFLRKNVDIYVPNAFSPNGDGTNDLFLIYAGGNAISKINSFKIFSRWGESVYEQYNFPPNDPQYGWDGKHKGEMMNPAVFVWFTEVELVDGSVRFLEGDVTIIR